MESNEKSKFSSANDFEIPSEPPSYDELFGTENNFFLDINDSDFLTGVFEFKLKQKFKADGTLKIEIKFDTNSSLLVRPKENIIKEHPFIHFKMEFTFTANVTGQMKLPETIFLRPYLQKIDTKHKAYPIQKDSLSFLKNSVGASVMRRKPKAAFESQTTELYDLWTYDPFKKKHKCNFEIPLLLKGDTVENIDLFEEAPYLLNFDTEIGNIKKLLETGFPIKVE